MQLRAGNEAERLFELHATHILDSPPAPEFDDLVAHVRDMFDLPICLLSLVDEHRIWFKARCGMDLSEAPRDPGVCQHIILTNDLLVVEDVTKDPRFRDNPLVVGKSRIRFYAGAPVRVRAGITLGSLCVIGFEPRTITDRERTVLQRLSRIAAGLIAGHKLAHESLVQAAEANRNRCLFEEQHRLLELRERRFKQTERVAKVGGWELDLASQTLHWSDEIYRIHDLPIGMPVNFAQAKGAYSETEQRHIEALFKRAVETGQGYDDQFEFVSAIGTKKWIRSTCDVEFIDGKAARLFGTSQDVSESYRMQKILLDTANRDGLTKLSNRKHFSAVLDDIVANRSEAGLLMVDVDHLKEVNDTLGHAAGDELIKSVAERLTAAAGSDGTVARIGGDEFAIVLHQKCLPADLAFMGQAILQSMLPAIVFADRAIQPQVCIGGATLEKDDTAASLSQKADLALYHAKKTRRGSYVAFHDNLRQAIVERVRIVQEIETGIADDRIIPYYQPVIELRNSQIVGFEALTRLRTKDDIIVIPRDMQEASRDFKLTRRVTDQMLGKVAQDLRTWLDAGIPFQHVGINLARADLHDVDFPRRIADAFARVAVPLKHVIVEVAEAAFTGDRELEVAKRIATLRRDGILVALDDFGTGHASLTHLKNVPVDIIKINQSFIAGMLTEVSSNAIVETLMDLGRRLGVRIVAGGIENSDQLDRLLQFGCLLGQGNYFAPPADYTTATYLMKMFGFRQKLGARSDAA